MSLRDPSAPTRHKRLAIFSALGLVTLIVSLSLSCRNPHYVEDHILGVWNGGGCNKEIASDQLDIRRAGVFEQRIATKDGNHYASSGKWELLSPSAIRLESWINSANYIHGRELKDLKTTATFVLDVRPPAVMYQKALPDCGYGRPK